MNNVAKCIAVLGMGVLLSAGLHHEAFAASSKKGQAKPVAKVSTAKTVVAKAGKAQKISAAPVVAKGAKSAAHGNKLAKNAQAKPVKLSKAQLKAERLALARGVRKPGMLKASLRLASASERTMERVVIRGKNGKRMVVMRQVIRPVVHPMALVAMHEVVQRQSFGQLAGLHAAQDPLDLKSSVALVIDQDTQEVLFSKNDAAVLPIASLTKLMTGVVLAEAGLDMGEPITISQDDVDTEKGSRSRLGVGTQLTRGELMLLALMSSENRAAHALGRTYPGGLQHFVQLMNSKANQLGMKSTRYVEPTGLSSNNQSSAQDLATLVAHASNNPLLRQLSTLPDSQIAVGEKTLNYVNTNRLTRNPEWEIGLQKTGYISEAGQCLVMQAKIAGRKLIMVFLDSAGKLSRIGDAERVRKWVENGSAVGTPVSVVAVEPKG